MSRRSFVLIFFSILSFLFALLCFAQVGWSSSSSRYQSFFLSRPSLKRPETSTADFKYEVDAYDYLPTATELNCSTFPANPSKSSIPNTVHFLYALDPSGAELPFINYLAIRAAITTLKPDTVLLHHTYLNTSNDYIQRLSTVTSSLSKSTTFQLVHHDAPETLFGRPATDYHIAHRADFLRHDIIYRNGGVYLDSDVFALQSFAPLMNLHSDTILGHEGGNRQGAANAVIVSRPNSTFMKRWIDSYADFGPGEWSQHSVYKPKELAGEHPDETDKHIEYMHEPLSVEETAEVAKELQENGGALYEGQFAYHAWHQLARKYLNDLTPDKIRTVDTRFNMMVRRFLET
ncbi:MAG: hypothetical protein Q9159_003959 [Coniocarpon cinnabarinum]